jgi:hypothetical protein
MGAALAGPASQAIGGASPSAIAGALFLARTFTHRPARRPFFSCKVLHLAPVHHYEFRVLRRCKSGCVTVTHPR